METLEQLLDKYVTYSGRAPDLGFLSVESIRDGHVVNTRRTEASG
jgi:hypothetical protein